MLSILNNDIRTEMIENKLHKWSRNEEQFLINNYKNMSNRELSRKLNIKQKSVANKLFNLHLKREKTASGNMLHKWAREEEQFLINNYKTMSNKELSRRLGIKQKSVANKLFNLHLKKEKKVGETHIVHVATSVEGKYANLKGMLFELICDKYIKQRYSGMLILSSHTPTQTIHSSNASSIGFVCEDTKTLRRMVKVFPHLKEREGFGMAIGFDRYFNHDFYKVYPLCDLYTICDFSNDISANERKVLIEILKEEEKKERRNLREQRKKHLRLTDFM